MRIGTRLLVVIPFPEFVISDALARVLLIILIKAASVFPGGGVLNRLVGQGCGNSNACVGSLITAEMKNPFPFMLLYLYAARCTCL